MDVANGRMKELKEQYDALVEQKKAREEQEKLQA
jgi:hypothetical protein